MAITKPTLWTKQCTLLASHNASNIIHNELGCELSNPTEWLQLICDIHNPFHISQTRFTAQFLLTLITSIQCQCLHMSPMFVSVCNMFQNNNSFVSMYEVRMLQGWQLQNLELGLLDCTVTCTFYENFRGTSYTFHSICSSQKQCKRYPHLPGFSKHVVCNKASCIRHFLLGRWRVHL